MKSMSTIYPHIWQETTITKTNSNKTKMKGLIVPLLGFKPGKQQSSHHNLKNQQTVLCLVI